jgi:hypothetical protein
MANYTKSNQQLKVGLASYIRPKSHPVKYNMMQRKMLVLPDSTNIVVKPLKQKRVKKLTI